MPGIIHWAQKRTSGSRWLIGFISWESAIWTKSSSKCNRSFQCAAFHVQNRKRLLYKCSERCQQGTERQICMWRGWGRRSKRTWRLEENENDLAHNCLLLAILALKFCRLSLYASKTSFVCLLLCFNPIYTSVLLLAKRSLGEYAYIW